MADKVLPGSCSPQPGCTDLLVFAKCYGTFPASPGSDRCRQLRNVANGHISGVARVAALGDKLWDFAVPERNAVVAAGTLLVLPVLV